MTKTDAESFRSKLCLLVIDKLIIGAIIAGAIVVYDRLKEETQLDFKRAEYVRELIPIVLDDGQDMLYRASSLASLVQTSSIDGPSAMKLAQKLLLADYLALSGYSITAEDESGSRTVSSIEVPDRYLSDILIHTMPAAFPAMLSEYHYFTAHELLVTDLPSRFRNVHAAIDFDEGETRDAAAGFWRRFFLKTLKQYDPSLFDSLTEDRLVATNLQVLDHIMRVDVAQLPSSNAKGLRIIRSVRALTPHLVAYDDKVPTIAAQPGCFAVVTVDDEGARSTEAYCRSGSDTEATNYLLSLIVPSARKSSALQLASEVLVLMRRHQIVDARIRSRVVSSFLEQIHHERTRKDDPVVDEWLSEVGRYVMWLGTVPRFVRDVEQDMLPEVQGLYEEMKTEIPSSREMAEDPRATLVCFLLLARSVDATSMSSDSQELLRILYRLDPTVLQARGLENLPETCQLQSQFLRDVLGTWW